MQFFNPIWLFALGALSIPIAIHLWNIRKGKTLKVGSIALINASSSKRSRSFKLHDMVLLLLRCLLLTLLALVLTMPYWQKPKIIAAKGWVLMPKENISESYNKFKPQIDSLLKTGAEFHYFDKDFPNADLYKVLTVAKTAKDTGTNQPASYWNLLRALDRQLPTGIPIHLFTSNRVNYFTGSKPQVALHLYWQTYTPADSIKTWIESAWFTNANDIKVIQGYSEPSATYFKNYMVKSGQEKNSQFLISVNQGQPVISLKDAGALPVNIDTTTLHYAIFTENNKRDAAYVKAALEAVSAFSQRKTIIKQFNNATQIPAGQNWIFWLSTRPVSKTLLTNSNNLFVYEPGKANPVNSWISNDNSYSLAQDQQKIPLYQLITASNNKENIIWHDGFGNPVLSLTKQQQTNTLHFYSRFDPAWNDLVWSNNFPKMLLKLIINREGYTEKNDKRALNTAQLQPDIIKEKHGLIGKQIELIYLSHYFWLLLVLTLFIERWLAHKNKALQNG